MLRSLCARKNIYVKARKGIQGNKHYIHSLNNPVYAKKNTFNRNANFRESYSRAEPARAFRRFVLFPLIYHTCRLADTVHQLT